MQEEEAEAPGGLTIQGAFSIGRAARAKLDRQIEGLEVALAAGVDAESLWATARRLAAAVTVVTAQGDEGYLGITVSACCLASLDPPLALVCIHAGSQALDAIASSGSFAVTILSSRQELLAEMFAGRAPRPDPSFSSIKHRTVVTGAPILEGGLAWLDCRLHQMHPAGDHTIFLGTVVAAGVAAGQDDPLLYFGSQYRRLAP
jgi:flavin reductase (DIM6/NTAB) family NADH-FMN oxidoreductase RutF